MLYLLLLEDERNLVDDEESHLSGIEPAEPCEQKAGDQGLARPRGQDRQRVMLKRHDIRLDLK